MVDDAIEQVSDTVRDIVGEVQDIADEPVLDSLAAPEPATDDPPTTTLIGKRSEVPSRVPVSLLHPSGLATSLAYRQ